MKPAVLISLFLCAACASAETAKTVMLPGNVPLELVRITSGTFTMGANTHDGGWFSANENPSHTVTIAREFYMGKFELTQSQWLAVMGGWPGTAPTNPDGQEYPAYNINYNDITAVGGFLEKLNALTSTTCGGTFRLPSEAEWECACRAGSQTRFCFGDSNAGLYDCSGGRDLDSYAWYCGNSSGTGPKPVGQKLPNAWGLYDMHGNVQEFCQDLYHTSYDGAPVDGSPWVWQQPGYNMQLLRSGGWADDPHNVRSARRNYCNWYESGSLTGFRVVWTPPPPMVVYLPGGVPLEMVRIPAGNFQMGANANDTGWSSADEYPAHNVTIGYDFYMGKFEVTQRQWLALMATWPHDAPSTATGVGDDFPVYNVSWDDVSDPNGFIDKLNQHIAATGQGPADFRLPSEAEWEYACRAGTQTRFSFGNSNALPNEVLIGRDLSQYAWYVGNNVGTDGDPTFGVKRVGTKLPNGFGLYDMHGNVQEYCQDARHMSYDGAPTDGSAWIAGGDTSYRSLRGDWWAGMAISCRSASRNDVGTYEQGAGAGLRLVRGPAAKTVRQDRYTTCGTWVYGGDNCLSGTQGVDYGYDSANQALRLRVFSASSKTAPRTRMGGWYAGDPSNTITYGDVGSSNVLRAKFYVYATGQANPAQKNQIPAFSMRVASRFAITSNLEVTPHLNAISQGDKYTLELAPSVDPNKPSVYRVDYDPIDVPYLTATTTEPIYMSFAVNCFDWQDNGYLGLKEISLCTYPASLLPNDPGSLKKTYLASAGDLDTRGGAATPYCLVFDPAQGEGAPAVQYIGSGPTIPTVTTSTLGTTYNSSSVPTSQIGIAEHYFSPNRFGALPWSDGPRVQANKQYKIRFHVTSTQHTNRQSPFWLYTRSIGYSWIQKTEFGGSWAVTDSTDPTNRIIRQAQPGVETLVTDGWYDVLMNTPMQMDIRADAPSTSVTLAQRMPNICGQGGPGDNKFSWRELCCGAMFFDSLNWNWAADRWEVGDFTVDQVEVREYDAVLD